MEPAPPALEAWSLNHWTAREVSPVQILKVTLHLKLLQNIGYIYCAVLYVLVSLSYTQ